jgi:hypothetical protein
LANLDGMKIELIEYILLAKAKVLTVRIYHLIGNSKDFGIETKY